MTLKPLSVYLHFPFCVRKCRYCDFLSFPADETIRDAYLNQLQAEILCLGKLYQKDYEIASIFIGGGTPSLMDSKQLFALVEKLTQIFSVRSDAEISIECNPGTVDAQKLSDYQHIGINRISFGLQSMNDEELQYLGRIHTVKQFLENYEAAKAAGFENINIDLMSSLPDQTVWRWNDTLQKTIALKPNHISAYSLII